MQRENRLIRFWPPLAVVLLGGCAIPPAQFGTGKSDAPARSFVLSGNDQAFAAVRHALVADGYEEREDGELRVEVGFAVRPTDLAVLAPAEGQEGAVLSPAAAQAFALCKRQAYVLTLAFVERGSGAVASRRGATMPRCSGTLAEILPILVHTALHSPA